MKLSAISFSYANNSMQTRGLTLLHERLKFNTIFDVRNIPVCDSNKSDGNVPLSVIEFDNIKIEKTE